MVQYNPKDWITFIFRFHKSDTFRQLIPMMILIGAYSGAICYFEIHYFKLKENSHVKNISISHTTVGFVLSLLLAYRTNTAYDRWWEGRKLWGAIVNDCRSAILKITTRLGNEEDKKEFARLLSLYIYNAKNNLRANKNNLVFQKYEDFSAVALKEKIIYCMTHFEKIKENHPSIKSFPVSETEIKVPAGWLIEQAGWKGKKVGNVGVHEKQALGKIEYPVPTV